jgi:hypothetical protein
MWGTASVEYSECGVQRVWGTVSVGYSEKLCCEVEAKVAMFGVRIPVFAGD